MTRNEIQTVRVASEIARGEGNISKEAIRQKIRGLQWEKDGRRQDQRVDAAWSSARDFREIIERRRRAREITAGPSLEERLLRLKRRRFLDCVQRANFRTANAGEHLTFVTFVNEPERVKAIYTTTKGAKYSRKCGFRRTNSEHRYFVQRLWHTMVQQEGIALLDGLLTIYAGPRETTDESPEVAVYRAAWVGQSRGFGINSERGYIARLRNLSYHAATREAAIRGVLTKQKQSFERPPKRTPKFELAEQMFGDYPVTLDDSKSVGNCEPGTLAWCYRVGIDPEKPVTLAQVIRGYRVESCVQALRVIRKMLLVARSSPPPNAKIRFTSEGGFDFSVN